MPAFSKNRKNAISLWQRSKKGESTMGGVIPNISCEIKNHLIDSPKKLRTAAEEAVDQQAVHIISGGSQKSSFSLKAVILEKIEVLEKFRARLSSRQGYEVHPPSDPYPY